MKRIIFIVSIMLVFNSFYNFFITLFVENGREPGSSQQGTVGYELPKSAITNCLIFSEVEIEDILKSTHEKHERVTKSTASYIKSNFKITPEIYSPKYYYQVLIKYDIINLVWAISFLVSGQLFFIIYLLWDRREKIMEHMKIKEILDSKP